MTQGAIDAIEFSLKIEDHFEARSFLEGWVHGDTSEWPEFKTTRAQSKAVDVRCCEFVDPEAGEPVCDTETENYAHFKRDSTDTPYMYEEKIINNCTVNVE